MGTWGSGPFENDAAMDWTADFESHGTAAVRSAIAAVRAIRDPDVDASSAAIAACACVAAALDGDVRAIPEESRATLVNVGPSLDSMNAEAREALHQVMAKSELRELWEESGELEDWLASSNALLTRLRPES